ncbi:DUF4412 domain-containing protein [[Muricauda] lutisoli]|uniref:DUF4412 domain-containing protein n=1 Tax=[Muricauda] lutisoli TaxID=2816035 RepID=A0ABS3EW15_9FLAO|nr:DUF4412 domain-containing protein [[Muricauda] lutisoli]MBO0330434.1 DUF4412 domain-containing protein [[Muricauda] lutisoli]
MNTKKVIYSILIVLFVAQGANAQFFKKLKKKVSDRVERTVTDKVADKAAQKASKAMDKMLDPEFNKNSPVPIGGEMGNMDDVPDEYQFEWVYKMKIDAARSKSEMDIAYYLKKDAPYWGAKMNQGMDMFMIYDMSKLLTVIFMDNDGNKFASVTKIPDDINVEEMNEDMDISNYTMTEIAGKTVLGYDCKGYVMENDKYKFTLYNTFDTEVSFIDIYGKSNQMPKGFQVDWLKEGDNEGLVMEMIMEDKENDKNNMTMTCVQLEEQPFSIKKADYSTFGNQ